MPESEPKPKLIELVAPGAGQGWKAVLRNGKAAVVHEIPVPPAEATAAVPRMQRLYEHRHPALSPVLAWGIDNNGLWVAVEPNEGTPLGGILTRGPLTPPAAAALGAAVLSGVAALHEAGIALGGFGAAAVRVTTNGDVRLAGHPAAAVRGAPSQSDLRADVRSAGMAVCAAFGVDPAGAPAPANIPPGLVVTMRSMASGAMGPSADRAQGALREMAAALLAPDRQMQAQSELATRAGGREVPPITPFLPDGTSAPQGPSQPAAAAPAPAPVGTPVPIPAPPPPFISSPPRRDESPVRQAASYEAPDRPLQTYPSIPAPTFTAAAAAAAAAPPVDTAAAEPATEEPAIPTWSEAPVTAPVASVTTPPAPPVVEERPEAPAIEPSEPQPPPVEPPAPPPPPTWSATPPPAPAPTWSTSPPAPSAPSWSTSPPPVSAPVEPPPAPVPAEPERAPEKAPSQPTWTPLEQPVWKPGSTAPAEPLGTGEALPTFVVPPTESEAPPTPSRPIPVAPSAPARKPPPATRPPRLERVPPRRPARMVPAAIAVAIVLLLGGVGVIVLANRGGGGPVATGGHPSPSAKTSGSPRSSPSTSPTGGAAQAVPIYAPSSAAPVTRVQFCTTSAPCSIPGKAAESTTSCTLGSSCRVEVAIYFSSSQKSVPVSYSIKLFDRCTGQTTDLPGAKTTTPASGYIVIIPNDHLAVSIPPSTRSAALVAVTDKPGVAASQPLILGGESC